MPLGPLPLDGGMVITLAQGAASGWTPGSSAGSFYFAAPLTVSPGQVSTSAEFYIPTACTLKDVYFNWIVFGTKGSTVRTSTISLRVNHTTDLLIGNVDCSSQTNVRHSTHSQTLAQGDVINCRIDIPALFAPTITFVQAYLYLEKVGGQ